MEKLDKVIAGLEACNGVGEDCNSCPYADRGEKCSDALQADTLAVLQKMKKKYASAIEMAEIGAELVSDSRKADGDLISRGELEKALSMLGRMYVDGIADDKAHLSEQRVYEALRNARTVAAEPIVHARWKGAGLGDYLCSACWGVCSGGDRFKRCPHCGAHMDEEVAK